MSLELLQSVEKAEAKAEEVRAGAQKEAREMLKSVEEACAAHERTAALEHRALAQRILEDAKLTAGRGIAALGEEQAARREAMTAAARAKLDVAAKHIFERVVNHGAR